MGLHPTLAKIKRNLPAVARENGFAARVTSGYRSRAKQAWLYNRWLQGLQEYPVAPPGSSDHEKGLALDVVSTDTPKLVALLSSVGLFWAGPSDPVHFTMIARPKSNGEAFSSYSQEVGSALPSFLEYIPEIGRFFSGIRDPERAAESGLNDLLTAILGPL
jgi:hypothetical protein